MATMQNKINNTKQQKTLHSDTVDTGPFCSVLQIPPINFLYFIEPYCTIFEQDKS